MSVWKNLGFFVGGSALGVIAVVGLAILVGHADTAAATDQDKLSIDWSQSVQNLGIRAVFPPSEDYYVGDIYAAVFGKSSAGRPFQAMKLAHIDRATQAVLDTYKTLPSFPETPADFDGTRPVLSTTNIFAPPSERHDLPLVAFPDFVVATASADSAGIGLAGALRRLFSIARTASESVQIKIPEAETYGIVAEAARALLHDFCRPSNQPPNPLCTQTTVRQMLSAVVGGSVLCFNDPARPKQSDSPDSPGVVGIFIISRVYLTRLIDYEYGSDTAVAATARVVVDKGSGSGGEDKVPAKGAADAFPAKLPAAAEKQIAGLGPGGQVAVASVTSNGVVLKRTLHRPVVIGYNSFIENPVDDGCVLAEPKASEKVK